MDALDLAILIESEAYERYRMFASQLGHRAPGDASSVFAAMAENEAKHGKQLLERRQQLFGKVAMRVSPADLFDVEAPEMGAPHATISTRGAFEVALASEQKALDFYNQALPHITDPDIIALFTELRDEEIEHVRQATKAISELGPDADREWEDDPDEVPAL
ncbi:MAG: ferritin family protein [Myxococcales bacterium]|nr:ferritin family protein [Myxococcales bacterium]